MTKTMIIKTTPVSRTRGFTLIEMLVVAALIAIFAGLAVFNIVEQLNREKEKAALAEARSIATAMSFAYDDLGFFPKLSFLSFGKEGLLKEISDSSLQNDEIEYHGFANPNLLNAINKNWGDKYMGGAMPEKYIRMRFGSPAKEMDWPADPFKRPYVAYFVKIEAPQGSTDPNAVPVPQWLSSFGDEPNYFAGIVSYGRNKTPGYTWDFNDTTKIQNRQANGALYTGPIGGNERVFQQIPQSGYNLARLQLLTENNTNVAEPTIRQAGSDDKFFEF